MFKKKKQRVVALEIDEYIIRAIKMNSADINESTVYESPMRPNIFEGDIIRDEMALYELIKELVELWGMKRHDVRFFVPDSSVMMKSFEHPADIPSAKLKAYVEMELGRTIHLPFSQPLIDVYDDKENDGEAVLFAAPSEEISKIASLLNDVTLHPTIADIRALSTIRFLEKTVGFTKNKSYLMTDWSIAGVSISIYTSGKLEFLRYQSIDTLFEKWKDTKEGEEVVLHYNGVIDEYRAYLIDQIAEIDRILNFYRFSLYKGEKAVDEIIVLGDSPEMDYIASEMKNNFMTPVKYIDDSLVRKHHPAFKSKHIPLLGLIYKEAF